MISLDLKKGMKLDLTKSVPTLKKVNMGLGWDTHMDLDSIAFLLDKDNKLLNTVYFGNKNGKGVRLNGDNLTGEGDGDDEIIFIEFDKVPQEVKKIALYVNIYGANEGLFSKGKTFDKVKGAYVRTVNAETNEEICKYLLTEDGSKYNAFHFADLVNENGNWIIHAIGEGANGSISQLEKKYK